jgi:hypothetical protein
MEANMNNGGRWDHIASEAEIKLAMGDPHPTMYESDLNVSFLISEKYWTIIRTSIQGGDVFEIQGGWVYISPFAMLGDVAEIRYMCETRHKL